MKILGIGMILVGLIGWKSYLFAGTGCAFLICVTLVLGGIALLCIHNKS